MVRVSDEAIATQDEGCCPTCDMALDLRDARVLLRDAARRLDDMVQMFRVPGCPDCQRAKLEGEDRSCAACSAIQDADELLSRLDAYAVVALGWARIEGPRED